VEGVLSLFLPLSLSLFSPPSHLTRPLSLFRPSPSSSRCHPRPLCSDMVGTLATPQKFPSNPLTRLNILMRIQGRQKLIRARVTRDIDFLRRRFLLPPNVPLDLVSLHPKLLIIAPLLFYLQYRPCVSWWVSWCVKRRYIKNLSSQIPFLLFRYIIRNAMYKNILVSSICLSI